MGIQGMKVHQFPRILRSRAPFSLPRLQALPPLAPKLPTTTTSAADDTLTATTFDLKSFIRPESGPRKVGSSDHNQKKESAHQVLVRTFLDQ
ncbi:UNVERIFIED_CONTAM: hypothetical protein Sradi_3775300 [Sesamum radiatum]|uniref:Uncharacterized protein n=1 Tax=Sesamum radiatum TaxID=300843 RepID=A0AAW2PZN6_SESRA